MRHIVGRLAHRLRDAVRRERDPHPPAAFFGNLADRARHGRRTRPDEVRMVVEHADLVDLGRARTHRLAGLRDVLAVLSAARVGARRREDERERTLDSIRLHLADRLGEHRVPVPIPPVHRKADAVFAEDDLHRLQKRPALPVDRTDAAAT